MQAARDMLFDCLGRDTEAIRNLFVGTLVKYPQRKCRPALRRQAIDGFLYKPMPFFPEQLGLERLTLRLEPRVTEVRQCASFHAPSMTVFVRSKIARRRKKKSPECRHRLALPVGTQKRFLDDLFRRLTRSDEAPNVSLQRVAALGEELRENLRAVLRRCRHSRIIRSIYATPLRGSAATLATGMGVFPLSGVVRIVDHLDFDAALIAFKKGRL
jgi:hypothetical protein